MIGAEFNPPAFSIDTLPIVFFSRIPDNYLLFSGRTIPSLLFLSALGKGHIGNQDEIAYLWANFDAHSNPEVFSSNGTLSEEHLGEPLGMYRPTEDSSNQKHVKAQGHSCQEEKKQRRISRLFT
jgi:hypothetical protein